MGITLWEKHWSRLAAAAGLYNQRSSAPLGFLGLTKKEGKGEDAALQSGTCTLAGS